MLTQEDIAPLVNPKKGDEVPVDSHKLYKIETPSTVKLWHIGDLISEEKPVYSLANSVGDEFHIVIDGTISYVVLSNKPDNILNPDHDLCRRTYWIHPEVHVALKSLPILRKKTGGTDA